MKSFANLILELLSSNPACTLDLIDDPLAHRNLNNFVPILFQLFIIRLGKVEDHSYSVKPIRLSIFSFTFHQEESLAPPPIVRRVNIIMIMAMMMMIIIITTTTTRRKMCNYGLVRDGPMVRH